MAWEVVLFQWQERERLSVLSDISSQQQVLCNEGIQIYKDKATAIHYITTLIKQITEA